MGRRKCCEPSVRGKGVRCSEPQLAVCSSTAATRALQRESSSIPIVFVIVSDPVGDGLVASLAKPAGNITGFTNVEASLGRRAGIFSITGGPPGREFAKFPVKFPVCRELARRLVRSALHPQPSSAAFVHAALSAGNRPPTPVEHRREHDPRRGYGQGHFPDMMA